MHLCARVWGLGEGQPLVRTRFPQFSTASWAPAFMQSLCALYDRGPIPSASDHWMMWRLGGSMCDLREWSSERSWAGTRKPKSARWQLPWVLNALAEETVY